MSWRPTLFPAALVALTCALLVAVPATGCGGEGSEPKPPPAAGPSAPGAPALLRAPLMDGEVLVDGEASPRTHGPFTFEGRYTIRFAQYAPEDPGLSFAGQTPFVAGLYAVGSRGRGSLRLFQDASKSGQRVLHLSGRYMVEVSFGDFPYAIRFTPDH